VTTTAAPIKGTCRVCGCTEERACPGGCAWADATETLCTRCYAETAVGLGRDDLTPCACCGGHLTGPDGKSITFWRFTDERFVLMVNAVRRAHGLDLMVGPTLAGVFDPGEHLAKRAGDAVPVLVCDKCSVEHSLAALVERIASRSEEASA